jgi:hypothetical protein
MIPVNSFEEDKSTHCFRHVHSLNDQANCTEDVVGMDKQAGDPETASAKCKGSCAEQV